MDNWKVLYSIILRQALILIMVLFYWYQLIKTLQRFGNIEKFDMLFHRRGPLEGQPRGYAFVTYADSSQATEAKTKLNGMQLGGKTANVKWAHAVTPVGFPLLIRDNIHILRLLFHYNGKHYTWKKHL